MKRSNLKRTSFKARKICPGVKRKRQTRIKQVGSRKRREMEACREFSRKFLDEYTCAGCGERFPSHQIQAHHWVPRSRAPGHPMLHAYANRLWLHPECHLDAHSGRRPELLKSISYLNNLTPEPK